LIKIDFDKCVGCQLCMKECPFNAIEFIGKYPDIGAACKACGVCVEKCPFNALSLLSAEKKIDGNWTGILVFAEQIDGEPVPVVYELLGKARELAEKCKEKVHCIILAEKAKSTENLISHGADKVHVFEHAKLKRYNPESYAKILSEFVMELRPSIFLMGATSVGRELAPKTSSRLRTGLTADCTVLTINDDGLLVQTRPAFGGNIMASIVSPTARPQMASVRYKVMEKIPPKKRNGEVVGENVDERLLSDDVEVLDEVFLPKEEDIVNANVIVSGGKGMGKKESFTLLYELAGCLGASVGASRPAVDASWAEYPSQVGLSGKTVKPELYIACGISGSTAHIAGMETSKVIAAINNDPDAPIFNYVDFGIVGDVNEVLPEIISEIRKRTSKKNR
jgi:electron transfer flavoprotein alpha subunit